MRRSTGARSVLTNCKYQQNYEEGTASNAKIAKDAKETVQECVSEFISFITSE